MTGAGLERPHHNLAGVGPYPHFEGHLPSCAHAIAIAANVFLDAKRSVECSLWMVLACDRCTE